jgi:hypothetical protein
MLMFCIILVNPGLPVLMVEANQTVYLASCELAQFNQTFKSFSNKKQAEIITQLLPVRN